MIWKDFLLEISLVLFHMVRIKHRYILFELLETSRLPEQKELLDKIRQSLQLNFGTTASGLLNSSLYLKYYSQKTGKAILQADRAHYRYAWAALTFLQLDGGVIVRSLGISGTIRKAQKRLIKFDKDQMFLMS